MARFVVTGGAGYVGLPLCRQLVAHGHEVTVLDNGASGAARSAAVRSFASLEPVDITDRSACVAALRRARPEVVVHLAAIHFIPECNRRPVDAVTTNVLGTQTVLDGCAETPGVARVVVTSSAAVYPITDAFSKPSDPTGPTDIYGITKATNEWQARAFSATTGIPSVAVRLYNVFGPGETNPHLLPDIIDQLRTGKTVLSLGNTSPKRSYVYIDDVVNGFEAIANTALPEKFTVLNLGNREEASVLEVLAFLSAALGKTLTTEQNPERTRASDRPFLRCDPQLTEELTGWASRTSIEHGLRELLRHEQLL